MPTETMCCFKNEKWCVFFLYFSSTHFRSFWALLCCRC